MSSQVSQKSQEVIQNAQHVIRKNSDQPVRQSNTGSMHTAHQQFQAIAEESIEHSRVMVSGSGDIDQQRISNNSGGGLGSIFAQTE